MEVIDKIKFDNFDKLYCKTILRKHFSQKYGYYVNDSFSYHFVHYRKKLCDYIKENNIDASIYDWHKIRELKYFLSIDKLNNFCDTYDFIDCVNKLTEKELKKYAQQLAKIFYNSMTGQNNYFMSSGIYIDCLVGKIYLIYEFFKLLIKNNDFKIIIENNNFELLEDFIGILNCSLFPEKEILFQAAHYIINKIIDRWQYAFYRYPIIEMWIYKNCQNLLYSVSNPQTIKYLMKKYDTSKIMIGISKKYLLNKFHSEDYINNLELFDEIIKELHDAFDIWIIKKLKKLWIKEFMIHRIMTARCYLHQNLVSEICDYLPLKSKYFISKS